MLKLYDTYARKIREFVPIKDKTVGLYTCGPTVYNFAHIGNLKTYIVEDILKRVLTYDGYSVRHVMNITDVGHLTSDQDSGEDKLEKGAEREHRSVWELADFYARSFFDDLKLLNIVSPDITAKATEHIKDQLAIIEILAKKGFAYETKQAVYFDVSKFPDYSKLTGQKLDEKQTSRQEVVQDPDKKHPADFALWFKLAGRFENHVMHWPSPFGEGFPGWHIECSAMSAKYLGQPFDIHTGGIDHVPVHHANEIAQSQAAFDKPLANYWIHSEYLLINQGKMAKSEGNFYRLKDVVDKGFDPLAFRYLVFASHYRSKMNFSWESLSAAQNALRSLYETAAGIKVVGKTIPKKYWDDFSQALNDDLNTPKALAVIWDMLRSSEPEENKLAALFKFDEVLGLNLKEAWETNQNIPADVKDLVLARDKAREEKDFTRSDSLRKDLESKGFIVNDTPDGTKIKKKF
ncbi:MAG: cysteine--tRNA ligase [Acidobacteriaceae bacterium]